MLRCYLPSKIKVLLLHTVKSFILLNHHEVKNTFYLTGICAHKVNNKNYKKGKTYRNKKWLGAGVVMIFQFSSSVIVLISKNSKYRGLSRRPVHPNFTFFSYPGTVDFVVGIDDLSRSVSSSFSTRKIEPAKIYRAA